MSDEKRLRRVVFTVGEDRYMLLEDRPGIAEWGTNPNVSLFQEYVDVDGRRHWRLDDGINEGSGFTHAYASLVRCVLYGETIDE